MIELKILLNWASCAFLLSSGLLFMRRHCGDRSRLYLAWVWLICGLLFSIRLFIAESGEPVVDRVLPVENLAGGLCAIVILYLYPLEAISGGWLSRKYMIFFFLPGVILEAVLWLIKPCARELASFSEIWVYVGEFNVWFRLFVLLFAISFYTIFLYYIPYNWMKSSVYHRWIVNYSLKIQVIAILFVTFMLTGSVWVSSIHLLICILFVVTVTYEELFIRFETHSEESLQTEVDVSEVLSDLVADVEPVDPLVEHLRRLMDDEEIWRNPNIDLSYLALRLKTNRSYLSKAIQNDGYKNFSDMINRKRVAEFLKLADAGLVVNIQDSFFYVGFRSRETALRCFKKYVGMSPTDYLRFRMTSH